MTKQMTKEPRLLVNMSNYGCTWRSKVPAKRAGVCVCVCDLIPPPPRPYKDKQGWGERMGGTLSIWRQKKPLGGGQWSVTQQARVRSKALP